MKKHLTKIYEQIVYGLRKWAVSACLKYNFPFEWQNFINPKARASTYFFKYFWCAKYARSERISHWRYDTQTRENHQVWLFSRNSKFPCVVNTMQIQPRMLNVCQCTERTIHLLYANCCCVVHASAFRWGFWFFFSSSRFVFSFEIPLCLLWLLLLLFVSVEFK